MATTVENSAPISVENRFEVESTEYAILFDSSKCTACKGCQVACKVWNELPSSLDLNAGEFTGSLQNPPDLGPYVRTLVTFDEADNGKKYGVNWAFGHRGCMHCTHAACVEVCPSGCLQHSEHGFVVYDAEKCIGCQYCRSACPFDVPRHTGVDLAGGNIRINKCDGCPDRIAHGMAPACVSTCQPRALTFGKRDELLQTARDRVQVLHDKGYKDARVYGETEVGGTHVIQILKYPIEQYSYLPKEPESQIAGAYAVMKPLAGVAVVGVAAAVGLTLARGHGYHRDEQAYDTNTHDVIDTDTGEVIKHIDKEAGER